MEEDFVQEGILPQANVIHCDVPVYSMPQQVYSETESSNVIDISVQPITTTEPSQIHSDDRLSEGVEYVILPLEEATQLLTGYSTDYVSDTIEKNSQANIAPFNCAICEQTDFCSLAELKRHLRRHKAAKAFSCENCLESFNKEENLKIHCLLHILDTESELRKENDEEDPTSYPCQICKLSFKRLVSLKHHLKVSHQVPENIPCSACGVEFENESSFDEHPCLQPSTTSLNQHLPPKTMFCDKCMLFIPDPTEFRNHMDQHALQRKELQSKAFVRKRPLSPVNDDEDAIETSSKLRCDLRCPVAGCCKRFRDKSSLKRHLLSHSEDSGVLCDICGKYLRHKVYMKNHMATHSDSPGRFQCKFCDYSAHQASNLRTHLGKNHSLIPEAKEYLASFDGRKAVTYVKRKRKTDSDGNVLFACDFCPATFPKQASLNGHILRAHSKIKRFLDSRRKKGKIGDNDDDELEDEHVILSERLPFVDPMTNRISHQTVSQSVAKASLPGGVDETEGVFIRPRSPSNRRHLPFECSSCSMRFSRLSVLLRHTHSTHSKPVGAASLPSTKKPHQCDQCDKSFLSGYEKRRHVKAVHSDIRPHKCLTCGEAFSQRAGLLIHSKRHRIVEVEEEEDGRECERMTGDKQPPVQSSSATSSTPLIRTPSGTFRPVTSSDEDLSLVVVETPDAMFRCPVCPAVFSTRHGARFHVSRRHKDLAERVFQCPFCKKPFKSLPHCKLHIASHDDQTTVDDNSTRDIMAELIQSSNTDAADNVVRLPCTETVEMVERTGVMATDSPTPSLCRQSSSPLPDLAPSAFANHVIRLDSVLASTAVTDDYTLPLSMREFLDGDSMPPLCVMNDETTVSLSRNASSNIIFLPDQPVASSSSSSSITSPFASSSPEKGLTFTTTGGASTFSPLKALSSISTTPLKHIIKIDASVKPLPKNLGILHSKESSQFRCSFCPATKGVFYSKTAISRHINLVHKMADSHQKSPADGILCHHCGKPCPDKKSLNSHISLSHQPKNLDQNMCPICDKSFATPASLKLHSLLHSDNPKPIGCGRCEETFRTRRDVRNHSIKAHVDLPVTYKL